MILAILSMNFSFQVARNLLLDCNQQYCCDPKVDHEVLDTHRRRANNEVGGTVTEHKSNVNEQSNAEYSFQTIWKLREMEIA